ncbi:uncharacterized protein [Dysidea avara]|uniref:uncharacterized protein isoform X2 n=1 Tax=Dysidea avara TaxID=196820 RepID=UPI0033195E5B
MRKSSRAEVPMERYCFDYPRELFPVQQQSGLKEGYGKLSGWLSDGSLKRSGFFPYEKPLCGGVSGDKASWIARSTREQINFFHSTYHDVYVPQNVLNELCEEAARDFVTNNGSQVPNGCLGFRPCGLDSVLGAVYHPSGADMQQFTVGLLVDNKVLCTRSDSSGLDNSFVNYSKNCATHCVHEIDCYQMPSPIKEISVTTCHAKEVMGVRSDYHCAFFTDCTVNKSSELVKHYESCLLQNSEDGDLPQFQCIEHLGVAKCSKPTSAFCINSHSLEEVLLIVNNGTLHLWNLETGVVQPHLSLTVSELSHWWDCCYAAHPRQAIIADCTSISLLDFRNSARELCPLLKTHHNPVTALSSHPLHPYHTIVATVESLLVLDLRQPYQPLLTIHLGDYDSTPISVNSSCYMEVTATDSSDTTVLLSSHQQQLLINYAGGYVKWNGISQRPNVPAPRLTMNPHLIPHYNSLLNDGPDNAASYRLTSPLIGSCIVKSNDTEVQGIIELSQLGDLFYHEWNYVDNTDCCKSVSLPAIDETLWGLWQQEAAVQEQHCLPYQEESLCGIQSIDLGPLAEYIVDTDGVLKCLLCHSYQSAINNSSTGDPAGNLCAVCGCKLVPTKNCDVSVSADSGPQLLMQSCDLSSIATDEQSLVFDLWKSWNQEQPAVNKTEVSLPQTSEVPILSSARGRKRTRSGAKRIGF